jgi:hypothetical protein
MYSRITEKNDIHPTNSMIHIQAIQTIKIDKSKNK